MLHDVTQFRAPSKFLEGPVGCFLSSDSVVRGKIFSIFEMLAQTGCRRASQLTVAAWGDLQTSRFEDKKTIGAPLVRKRLQVARYVDHTITLSSEINGDELFKIA